MEQAGDESLPRAGLSLEKDGGQALSGLRPIQEPVQPVPDRLHGRAVAEQFGQFVHDACGAYCSEVSGALPGFVRVDQ